MPTVKRASLVRDVARAVVAEPFDFLLRPHRAAEAVLHGIQHDIAHHVTTV